MGKIYVQNLGMFVTEKCNLNCAHCCRGGSCNKNVSDEVIEKVFEQIKAIGNLSICGGEPTLAVDRIEKIFSYVIDHKILVDEVFMYLNGTNFSEELVRLCKQMNEYLRKVNRLGNRVNHCLIGISGDDYHLSEINKRGLYKEFRDNCYYYMDTGLFAGLIDLIYPLFREGNAVNLPEKLTMPVPILDYLITYVDDNKHLNMDSGFCNIGPLVAVNCDGIVTECDGSWDNQRTIYNYGNVFDSSIEEIVLSKGAKVLRPKQWERETGKLIKEYLNAK